MQKSSNSTKYITFQDSKGNDLVFKIFKDSEVFQGLTQSLPVCSSEKSTVNYHNKYFRAFMAVQHGRMSLQKRKRKNSTEIEKFEE
jgi:hypothetical protein